MSAHGHSRLHEESHKPAILCLHGRGTSGQIFQIQLARLKVLLQGQFDFVFPDGPFECQAGPGVLPYFEGCDPYFAWKNVAGIGGLAAPETVAIIDAAVKKQIAITGRSFIGVLGFSQGGTLTAGILLRQQLRSLQDADVDGFRFGVFLMSSCPPLVLGSDPMEDLVRIHVPTLHVIGSRDNIREMSKDMALKYFDQQTVRVLEFNAGHHMPQAMADIEKIAQAVIDLYGQASKDSSNKD